MLENTAKSLKAKNLLAEKNTSGNFSHNSLCLLLSFTRDLLDWINNSSDEKVSWQSGTKEYRKVTPETKLTQEIYWEAKYQKGDWIFSGEKQQRTEQKRGFI